MFWPVYYLLVLTAFAGLARLPKGTSGCAVCGGTALGCNPALFQRHDAMRNAQTVAEFPTALTSSFWQAAAGRYAHLESVQGLQADSLQLALWAADNTHDHE